MLFVKNIYDLCAVSKNKYYLIVFVFTATCFTEYGCAPQKKCPAYGENYNSPDLTVGKIKKRRKEKSDRLF